MGKNVVAYFVEVDLRGIVSSDILDDYKQEVIFIQLGKRQRDRARFKRIEDKIQKKISIRRKNDEEANNLLLSYFENPVVATVQKREEVKSEKKEEAGEKGKGEKDEDEEEDKKEQESAGPRNIWSKFGEVLKRPPREKLAQAAEKVEEEEEESPKKLTMFDMIKNR